MQIYPHKCIRMSQVIIIWFSSMITVNHITIISINNAPSQTEIKMCCIKILSWLEICLRVITQNVDYEIYERMVSY